MMDAQQESTPAPPPGLRKRVHGDEDLAGFERVGTTVAQDIVEAFGSAEAVQHRGYTILCA